MYYYKGDAMLFVEYPKCTISQHAKSKEILR